MPADRERARPAHAVPRLRAAGPRLDPVQLRRVGRRHAHAGLQRVRRRGRVRPPGVQETRDPRGQAHQAHRVHRDGRRTGGPQRVPAREGDGEGDVQDPGREPVGNGRAERRRARQKEVGLRGTGSREDHRLLGDHHERRRWRYVLFVLCVPPSPLYPPRFQIRI